MDAKANSRKNILHDYTPVIGYPMSTLDVPSIAAFTGAANIRFDFATGKSIGSSNGAEASVSGPKGNAHPTAVGVLLITDVIFDIECQSTPQIRRYIPS